MEFSKKENIFAACICNKYFYVYVQKNNIVDIVSIDYSEDETIAENANSYGLFLKDKSLIGSISALIKIPDKERIENEMTYPGQIKVNVVRETRAVELAK